jgi:hypothetical protein
MQARSYCTGLVCMIQVIISVELLIHEYGVLKSNRLIIICVKYSVYGYFSELLSLYALTKLGTYFFKEQ